MIRIKLLVQEAKDAGITSEEAYRFERERATQKLLLEAYAQRTLYDTLQVTQDELLGRVLTEATGPAASRFRAIHAHGRRMRRGKNDAGIEARARELFEIGAEKMGVLRERPACRKRRRAG